MPSLSLDENSSLYQIRAYKPGTLKINETIYHQSLIVTPQMLIEQWPPQRIDELTPAALEVIITLKPNILLIGTGATMTLLPEELYGTLINAGIGVEIMDTSAACRTFNALSAEGRNVAAALIIQ